MKQTDVASKVVQNLMTQLVSEIGSYDQKTIVHLGHRKDGYNTQELRNVKKNAGLDNMSCVLLIKE